MRPWPVWALALALGACGAAAEEPATMLEIREGDPCRWSGATCLDAQELLVCVDRVWTAQSCASTCEALAPGVSAGSCREEFELGEPAQLCACEPPEGGCEPAQGSCLDADTLRWCGPDWGWQSSSCASLCAEDSSISLGCVASSASATCLCTQVGTPCDEQEATSLCASSTELVHCEAGAWALSECANACEGGGSCVPGAAPSGAACECSG